VRARTLADAKRAGARPDGGFADREREYLKLFPHLAEQRHCGLAPDSPDFPRRKVVMPNRIVFYSAWYKVPTSFAVAKKDARDNAFLLDQARARARQVTLS